MSATPEHAMRVLGLDTGATVEDVRISRRNLAKTYHPDCAVDQLRATQHMARINAAADTLTRHLMSKPQRTNAHVHKNACDTSSCKPVTRQQTKAPQPTKIARPVDKANQTLIRMASASYSNALNALGTINRAPTVDVRALT